jgi:hypothetical protein
LAAVGAVDAPAAAAAGSPVGVSPATATAAAAGPKVMVIFKLRAESLFISIHVGHFRYCWSSTPACFNAFDGDITTETGLFWGLYLTRK